MTNRKRLAPAGVRAFQKKIYDHYEKHGRELPWRKTRDPYRILVSEIMLQQTQVERVVDKYPIFLAAFPGFFVLAKAPQKKLLTVWQGLGYNRRALALRALAQKVVAEHRGKLPTSPAMLIALPGIGTYSAGAIVAFAYNKPVIFMDTNIRRVYIHEFFRDRKDIRDDEIIPILEQTMDVENPRKWYNALMDYGTMLKKEHANPNRKSAHYTRQSPFENSNRQVRGRILKILVQKAPLTKAQIVMRTGMDRERVKKNLEQLVEEGFVKKKGSLFAL
jgi:A/G-specific adenine glycosylase